MTATEAIERLKALEDEYGDLELTVVGHHREFSLRGPYFNEEGPCPNIADTQGQSPPKRFVFEMNDDIQ
jgi:hypothetical protein